MRRISNVQRLTALAFLIWAIDFLTKSWAVENLTSQPRKVIGSLLQLTLFRNPGAAFGTATGFTVIFTALSIAVVIFIARYSTRIISTGWMVVGGLVLGGVLGNLTDRIFREPGFFMGHVIDWIELPHWPIFNIADSSIVIAALIAVALTMRNIHPFEISETGKGGRDE